MTFHLSGHHLKLFHSPHLKRRTLDYAQNKRRETIVVAPCIPLDPANERHITIVNHAPQSIRQKILRKRPNKSIGTIQNRLTQTHRTIQLCSVEHLTSRVHPETAVIG